MYCDVRDVVDAHIAAAETPSASGRYMVTHTHTSNPREVSDMLQVSPLPVMPSPPGSELDAASASKFSDWSGVGTIPSDAAVAASRVGPSSRPCPQGGFIPAARAYR